MTLSEPLARTRDRLTEMATELRHGKPGNYTLAVADRVPELLDHIEGLTAELARLTAIRDRLLVMTDLPAGSKPTPDLIYFADRCRWVLTGSPLAAEQDAP